MGGISLTSVAEGTLQTEASLQFWRENGLGLAHFSPPAASAAVRDGTARFLPRKEYFLYKKYYFPLESVAKTVVLGHKNTIFEKKYKVFLAI